MTRYPPKKHELLSVSIKIINCLESILGQAEPSLTMFATSFKCDNAGQRLTELKHCCINTSRRDVIFAEGMA